MFLQGDALKWTMKANTNWYQRPVKHRNTLYCTIRTCALVAYWVFLFFPILMVLSCHVLPCWVRSYSWTDTQIELSVGKIWISHLTQYIRTQQESKLKSRIHLLPTVFSWVSLFLSHGHLTALWGGPSSLPYSLLLNCITDTTLTWWLYCFSRVVSSLPKELLPLDTLHKYI